jgi:hypothetical protein
MKPNVCVNITESRIRAGSEESSIPPPPVKSNDVDVVVAVVVAALFNPILIIPELFDTTPPHISDTSSLDRIISMVATEDADGMMSRLQMMIMIVFSTLDE